VIIFVVSAADSGVLISRVHPSPPR